MRNFLFFLFAGLSLGVAVSCVQPETSDEAGSSDDLAAQELAESMANQENGLTSEIEDLASLAVPTDSSTSAVVSSVVPVSSVTVTLDGALDGFAWNEETKRYERDGADLTVSSSSYEGAYDHQTWIAFYPTSDASGDGVPLPALDGPLYAEANSDILSYRYHRSYTGSLTNKIRNLTRAIEADTEWTATEINDGDSTVVLNGTRVESVSTSGSRVSGDWVVTTTLDDLVINRVVSGSSTTTQHQGTLTAAFEGSWTTPRTTRTLEASTSIELNRETTTTITIDGSTVTVNLTTGEVD